MGGVRADPVALLDRLLTGPDRQSPYDHSHHHRAVLRQPGGHTRSRAGPRPPGIGHLYSAFWQRPEYECALSLALLGGGVSGSHGPGAQAAFSPERATDRHGYHRGDPEDQPAGHP